MKTRTRTYRSNLQVARATWGSLPKVAIFRLKELSEQYCLSLAHGDFQLLNGAWYITHTGLLQIAARRRCLGIRTTIQEKFSYPADNRWVFKAIIHKSKSSKGFVGYGDADPSNVSPLVRGAEMRVAETRAVNRALRKAYGIGLCSVEELTWEPTTVGPQRPSSSTHDNGHQNRNPRLRDRLCLLIRQHQLDANLVKAYAADSCGTPNLRDASREQIETFIANLSDWATNDRPALLCKLHSYSRPQEPTS